MEPTVSPARINCPITFRTRLTGWAARRLTWLLLAIPMAASAQFSFVTKNGAITITGHTDSTSEIVVTIPGTINGLPVTSIGDHAFSNSIWLANLTIPEGVTSIGSNAFNHCFALTNVAFPNSLTSIGDSAFFWCAALRRVTLPGGLTNLAHSAFAYADLRSIVLPDSLTSLGPSVFGMCGALTNVTLPNSLATIPESTFEGCSSLASFNIPGTVTNIEELAFANSGLVSVTIPDTVASLGVGVFDYCDKLVSVTVPGSIAVITNAMFAECSRLTSVTLGEGVSYIGNSAFDNCSSLWSITIPSTVTNLQSWAFGNCTALASVYFRGNPPVAGINTFIADDNVTVYYLPGNTNWGTLYAGRRARVWDPHVQPSGSTFGVRTNCFGFTIVATNASMVVVEACTNLANPIWLPVRTNLLVGGSAYFSDPRWTNYPTRIYRLRSW